MGRLHRLLLAIASLFLCGTDLSPAAEDNYPVRPITIVVPFAPGGAGDILGRLMAQELTQRLGQPIIVDNRPGAGSTIGGELVARSPNNGYTLLLGSVATLAAAPNVYSNIGYDPNKSFSPVSLLAVSPFLLVINSSVPAKSLQDLIDLAKAKPGQLNYGSSGNGTLLHLAGEMLKVSAGIDIVHVPYKGTAQALTDLVAGRVQMIFDQPAGYIAHIQSGKIRPIAYSASTRFAELPDVPTMAEAGLPAFDAKAWLGLVAPRGTSSSIINRLNAEVSATLSDPKIRQSLIKQGYEPVGGTPEEFARYIKEENVKFARVVAASGAKVD